MPCEHGESLRCQTCDGRATLWPVATAPPLEKILCTYCGGPVRMVGIKGTFVANPFASDIARVRSTWHRHCSTPGCTSYSDLMEQWAEEPLCTRCKGLLRADCECLCWAVDGYDTPPTGWGS